jgi:Tol biopolymer transport system component
LNTAVADVWLLDVESNALTRMTTEGNNAFPIWTSDSKSIVYISNRGSDRFRVWKQVADASSPAEVIFGGNFDVGEAQLAPDGHTLMYRTSTIQIAQQRDIWYVDLAGDKKPKPIVASRFNEAEPRLSPNGKWIAYQSDESGLFQIYVRPFPGPGAVSQVSVDGGIEPIWAPDGRRLFYRHARQLIAADVARTPEFRTTSRHVLFEGAYFSVVMTHASYDVAPDGKHFVMLRTDESGDLVVITNWLNELRARLAK